MDIPHMTSIEPDRIPWMPSCRVFAIVEEYGERVDGYIAGWGMAFDDRTEVVSVQGGLRMSTRSPENALRGFGFGTRITPRLVWVNPDAATRADE